VIRNKIQKCCCTSPDRYGHQLAGQSGTLEGLSYEQLANNMQQIEDMIANPNSHFRGLGSQVYNKDNYLKYNYEDWTNNPRRIGGTQKSYYELQNKQRSSGYQASSKGQSFKKNTKLSLSPEGKITNEEYLDEVAKNITRRMCPKCDTKKLMYKGQQMTFTDFYDQISKGIIEPKGQMPKQFVCQCY